MRSLPSQSTRRVQALPSAVFVLGARRPGKRARRRGRARRRSCWCCRRRAQALALAHRAWPSRARPSRARPPRARPTHLERGHLGQPRLAERDRKDGGRPSGRQPLAPVVRRSPIAAHVSGNRRSSSSAGRLLTVRSSEGMSRSLASPTAASSGSAPRRRPSRRSPLGPRADRGSRASRPASNGPSARRKSTTWLGTRGGELLTSHVPDTSRRHHARARAPQPPSPRRTPKAPARAPPARALLRLGTPVAARPTARSRRRQQERVVLASQRQRQRHALG